ncbi:MAG: HAMP domain-containing sensor histidine kinase [Tissierellia bacterium]|nr:HAMP domain-containing sensor histidine kinase [Tissierellia bacterium]
MKLSSKTLYYFSIAIIIVLLVTALFTSLAFRASLSSYLAASVEEQFRNKAEEISYLYSYNRGLDSFQLKQYAKKQNINIRIFNNDKDLIAEFYGIKTDENKDNKLLKKDFMLKDPYGNNLGIMELSYLENFYLYNNSINIFYKNLTSYYGIIIVIAVLLGYLMMSYFTNKLVRPIKNINEVTKSIRSGDYINIDEDFNIYEIDELVDNLNFLSDSLSKEESRRLNYAQDIAHELRTPLTNLLLHLEGIRDEIIQADPQTIDMLISEVNRLNHMVNNLHLSFNKVEKPSDLVLEELQLSSIIEPIIKSFKPKFDEKNIQIIKSFDHKAKAKIDKDKFTQVINNLISNSIKAVDVNGIIEVIISDYANKVIVVVKDNGVGIAQKDLDHIFDRFYRVDSARNRKTGGSGLGLAISKSYIELMNGKIVANSTEKKGSEFIISLNK